MKRTARAFAMDPKNPCCLYVVGKENKLEEHYVDRGIGCNDYEISALMKMLLRSENEVEKGVMGPRLIRKAVEECLEGWLSDEEGKMGEEEEKLNFELLEWTKAIFHLTEICYLRDSNANNMTADMVRFLRGNHVLLPDPLPQDEDFDWDEFLSMEKIEEQEDYWPILFSLVKRGCLADVWALISRHSACRLAVVQKSQKDLNFYRSHDAHAFDSIRKVLLSAPLPGGIEGSSSCEDEKLEDHPSHLWDCDSNKYHVHAAYRSFQNWQHSIVELLQQDAPLRELTRRIPPLKTLWKLLLGQQPQDDKEEWSEIILYQLLYVRPNISKQDLVSNQTIMGKHKVVDSKHQIFIDILQGHVTKAIQAIYSFGGSSGAALPSTLAALLCHFLIDANQMEKQKNGHLLLELLLHASSSIVSSFASQKNSSMGVRLAVSLLLPHIRNSDNPDQDQDRILYQMAQFIQHSYYPTTDADANTLLSLLQQTHIPKTRILLDASQSICFARYHHYNRIYHTNQAITWLLRGTDYLKEQGSCFTHLIKTCQILVHQLLSSLTHHSSPFNKQQTTSNTQQQEVQHQNDLLVQRMKHAKDVLQVVTTSSLSSINLQDIPMIVVLQHVVDIGWCLLKEDHSKAAYHIIACLKEQEGDPVTILAHPSTHSSFLTIANNILNKTPSHKQHDDANYYTSCPFTVQGIHVLLARFTDTNHTTTNENEAIFRESFCLGLMKAFVTENNKLRSHHNDNQEEQQPLMVPNYHTDSEHSIELLLGPCI